MRAEIITIGDEILIGQVVDTNSAWMGTQLSLIGIQVYQITSVSDSPDHIIKALEDARSRVDVILITGGLGPTKDDLTKTTLTNYFKTTLRFDEGAYEDVERLFKERGKEVTPLNRKQAEVPANCITIRNKNGTAPGMWFDVEDKVIVSMPGVPYEMKGMMQLDVLHKLKEKFSLPFIFHKTVLTEGIGESFLSELISGWEDSLVEKNIKLAYLPSPGKVRLRLSASGTNKEVVTQNVEQKINELYALISEYIYGYEQFGEEPETLEKIIGLDLKENKKTLATAESCTGGYIAHLITKVPGSSAYFKGSVIAYSNEIKTQELAVSRDDLNNYGAVSEQVVVQMAEGVRMKMKTDFAIATSGIAGPDGGSIEKPVGTVWIAVTGNGKISTQKFLFGNNRERNIQRAADAALNMLRKLMAS